MNFWLVSSGRRFGVGLTLLGLALGLALALDWVATPGLARAGSAVTDPPPMAMSPARQSGATPTPLPWPNPLMGSVAGAAFLDQNGNGQWDAEEIGLTNLTVRLTAAQPVVMIGAPTRNAPVVVATTVTDGQGRYRFAQAPVGQFHVELALPEGLTITTAVNTEVTVSPGAVVGPTFGARQLGAPPLQPIPVVPEPSVFWLFGVGLLALVGWRVQTRSPRPRDARLTPDRRARQS